MVGKLDPLELAFLDRLLTRLNLTVRRTVERSAAAGTPVYFVAETASAFQPDHTLCDPEPFARTIKSYEIDRIRFGDLLAGKVGGRLVRGAREFVHPNRAGYAAISATLLRWSRGSEAAGVQKGLAGGR
jgi:hypothetical protein